MLLLVFFLRVFRLLLSFFRLLRSFILFFRSFLRLGLRRLRRIHIRLDVLYDGCKLWRTYISHVSPYEAFHVSHAGRIA